MSFGVREALGIGLPKMRDALYRVISSSRNMRCDFFEVFFMDFSLQATSNDYNYGPYGPYDPYGPYGPYDIWIFFGFYRDRQ
jgi:hypothetical protein